MRTADNGDTEILQVTADGFKKVYTLHRLRNVRAGPLPQGRQARLPGDEQGRRPTSSRLTLFDPETGKEELVETDPLKRVDFGERDRSRT